MSSIFSLLFTLLFVRTSSVRVLEEGENRVLRLPLYHARGSHDPNQTADSPPPFSEVLSLDRARVTFLNSRLMKNSTTVNPKSRASIPAADPKLVDVPLNPGVPLGIGNYYIEVGLGTPPTSYPVVVDTGSSFSWVQCEPCMSCHPQAVPYFNPSASSTYQQLSCDTAECPALKAATLNDPGCSSSNVCLYESSYGDRSTSIGYLSKDSLSLGSEQALADFVFGCGQENQGKFGRSAGLFGLGRNKLSMSLQLSSKYGSVFSYCLPTNTPQQQGSGGFLTIGQTSSSSYKFTPMLSDPRDPTLYFLKLSAILVAGRELAVAASEYNIPTFIDSGTTLSFLTASVYKALEEEFVRIISPNFQVTEGNSDLNTCFKGTSADISKIVPPVKFIFEGGADVDLTPNNVIIEVEQGTTCLAFVSNSNPSEKSVIGNLQQQTIEVVYDLSNSRIGFATGKCQ